MREISNLTLVIIAQQKSLS